jgi:putative radical SAM enzyme (TIGR03279 family)
MSELVMAKSQGLVVSAVETGSPADRAGFRPQDVLRKVEGQAVDDVVDLRFLASQEEFTVEFVREGVYHSVQMEREWGEDLGFEFTFELADQIHTCDNKCVFCFIHQMPKGMRKSLYLMDDDFRLSFLHGNYVTLTNMSEEEFARTKDQGLSPLYVSVHAADPKLRGFMLGRGKAEPILPRIAELNAARIDVHCQIVLCPGLNDGAALDATFEGLANLHSARTGLVAGVLSVAIVPVGLSKFRHNLYPIRPVTPEYAGDLLDQAGRWRRRLGRELGTRFVFPSDEWFFKAGRPMPSRGWYENFPQFEDGVGTCRLFLDQAKRGFSKLPKHLGHSVFITLVTGLLPSGVLEQFAARLNEVENLRVDVLAVENEFFGSGITVAGLLTGQDILRVLHRKRPAGVVAIPDIALKDGALFLDNMTLDELRAASGCDARACPSNAKDFLGKWLPSVIAERV